MALTTLTLVPRACYCLPPLRFGGGRRRTRQVIKAELPSAAMGSGRPASKLMEFPHLTAAHRDLMVDLIQAVDDGVGEHLLPSTVPSDVEYYQNQTGTSQGTLLIRSALPPSPVTLFWL